MDLEIEIPTSWQKRRIRDLGDVVTGRTPSTQRDDFYGGEYNLISPADLDNGKYVITAHKQLTKAGFLQCRALPKNTVLIGCIGNIGKLGMVADERSATNQQINAVIPNRHMDADFIYYSLHANRARLQYAADKTTLPILNKTNFENFEIAVPELSEQRKIAWVLGLVQRALEHEGDLIALTTELKKALMYQLFTRGLRGESQTATEIGLMPESWTATPLGDCCDVLSSSLSYTDFMNAAPISAEDSVDCMGVKVSDMNLPGNENGFESANVQRRLPLALAQKKLIPPNAVVFPKRGAAIATNKKRLTTTWTVLDPNLIALRPKNEVDISFLFFWIQTFDLKSITDPGPTPQLNKKDLTPLLMPVPADIKEQQEIAGVLSTVEEKINVHRRKQASLGDLFRTLLYQLMTAKIRVRDLDLSALESAAVA